MSPGTKASKTTKASRPYEPWLKERLAADPEEAQHYLEAAIEDEDPRVFLLALRRVAEVSGGIGKLAKASGLDRVNLYRMLSERGNPELLTLSRVLNVLGLRLKVEPRVSPARAISTPRAPQKLVGSRGKMMQKLVTALARQHATRQQRAPQKHTNVLIKHRA